MLYVLLYTPSLYGCGALKTCQIVTRNEIYLLLLSYHNVKFNQITTESANYSPTLLYSKKKKPTPLSYFFLNLMMSGTEISKSLIIIYIYN